MASDSKTRSAIAVDLLIGAVCAGAAAVALSGIFNWSLVFSNNIPSGGDHPAHPYLMSSLREALFQHGAVVHYSYGFWGGFELFQFYFPLAYVLGAFLSLFFPLNVAYKLVIASSVLVFPVSFYALGRAAGMSRSGALIGSIAAICFLFTEAHTMWGGNMRSAVAGMFGSAWGFNLLALTIAATAHYYRKASEENSQAKLPILLPFLLAAAALSHFYSLVAAILFLVSVGVVELFRVVKGEARIRPLMMLVAGAVTSLPLFAWWFLPVAAYKRYSSEFGGNWDITLLDTIGPAESILASVVLFGALEGVLRDRNRKVLFTGILFFGLSLLAYCATQLVGSAALSNIRLWPGLYFSLYVLLLVVLESALRRRSLTMVPLLLAVAACLPSSGSLRDARIGFESVMGGILTVPGSDEVPTLLEKLDAQEPTRVSFESDARNHRTLNSIRFFEALPYLTKHEIVEGGIVNSAALAGIPYTLQCLTSITCAGWPRGTLVPEKSTERAVELMRGLGVRLHIASSDEMRERFRNTEGVRSIWSGRYFELFEIADGGRMVEVFDGPPVSVVAEDQNTLFPALVRLDAARNVLVVAVDNKNELSGDWPLTSPGQFLSFYYDQWEHGTRPFDRGIGQDQRGWINTYLLPVDCSVPPMLEKLPTFSIGDRGLVADHFFQPSDRAKRCLIMPLSAEQPGAYKMFVILRGYDAFQNGKQLKEGDQLLTLEAVEGGTAGQAFLLFKPNGKNNMQYAHVRELETQAVRSRLLGEAGVTPSKRITDHCETRLERGFHRLELHSSCPGKPHLVKYNYFPKWQADVPVYRGSYGYMVLTPRSETTVIAHRQSYWEKMLLLCAAVVAAGLIFIGLLRALRRPCPSLPTSRSVPSPSSVSDSGSAAEVG